MKPLLPALVIALLTPIASAAQASGRPQARPRLQPMPAGTAIRIMETPAPAPNAEPGAAVALEKMTVQSSKLPSPPRPLEEPPPDSFSFTKGGLLHRKKFSGATVELSLRRWTDLLAEDARFKPPPTHPKLEVLRVKW
ncbi:MAG TPA: hypothetical protein VEA63_14735 [Opitutus sp.]|nr:hypothetical protein [Opitutus sp.]